MKLLCLLAYFFLFTSTVFCKVQIIRDQNWKKILEGEWMILIYAPWCPACQAIKPDWERFGKEISDEYPINIGSLDITKQPITSGSFSISRLPSFFHVKDGIFRQYTGDRRLSELKQFILQKRYNLIEPLKWYYNPSSYHMRFIGYLFLLSQIILKFQNTMETKYSIPVWLTYIMIGGTIVVVGVLFSLSCLCCVILMNRRNRNFKNPVPKSNRLPLRSGDQISVNTDHTLPDHLEIFNVEQKVGEISLNGDNHCYDNVMDDEEGKKTK